MAPIDARQKQLKPALAILAKTPTLSPVKTRLAADIGHANAQAFYRLCLHAVEDLAKTCADTVHAYWAVAEEGGLADPLWKNLDRLWTGEGSFGERLHHVYNTLVLKHGAAVLIGADSPQLTIAQIKDTAQMIRNDPSCIVGPARDGGFYLFGGSMQFPASVWLETPYSVSETLSSLKEKLAPLSSCRDLGMLTDVDTMADLAILQREWKNPLTRFQADLQQWIDRLPA